MTDAAQPGELGNALRPLTNQEPESLDQSSRQALTLLDYPHHIPDSAPEPVGGFEGEFAHAERIQVACVFIQLGCIVRDMELTKHTHATVALEKDGASLVIDPGAYTPNSAELVAGTSAVLVTHDHPDHFDAGILNAALAAQPELRVWAPASVVDALDSGDGRVVAVSAGDSFTAAGFEITTVGEHHAPIHQDLPPMDNVGFIVDGSVYHPGDSYFVPEADVDILLLPTSGPWAKLGEGVDFVRAVAPSRTIQIHDLMLSDAGRGLFTQTISGLSGIPLETLELGQTVTV